MPIMKSTTFEVTASSPTMDDNIVLTFDSPMEAERTYKALHQGGFSTILRKVTVVTTVKKTERIMTSDWNRHLQK